MNWELYRQIGQPVREVRGEGLRLLKNMNAERATLTAMEHLQELLRAAEGEPTAPRVVFLAAARELAVQGAAAWMSLTASEPSEQEQKANREAQQLFELFTQTFAPEESVSVPPEEVSWKEDLLVVPAGTLAPEPKSPDEMLLAAQGGRPAADAWRQAYPKAEQLLIDGFDGTLSDAAIEEIAGMRKRRIFLAAPEGEASRYALKRLCFEQGFRVVRISRPEESYYIRLMSRYLALRGLRLEGVLTEAALLRRLRRYRGSLFRERDVLQFVDSAAGRSDSAVLGRADFALFGEAEEQAGVKKLARLIGLSEVKQSVMALYAARNAEPALGAQAWQRHNNLVFSGNPGTGKSVVARLYGEILAESGMSNGRFIAAGRKDLVGKYLGHTAPQVDELFKRAEGGVLFISASLYTKKNHQKARGKNLSEPLRSVGWSGSDMGLLLWPTRKQEKSTGFS